MGSARSALYRSAFRGTYRAIRLLRRRGAVPPPQAKNTHLRVAFIHNERKLGTGAHHINELMAQKLRSRGLQVRNFYPRQKLMETAVKLKGLANILFFHSLLEHKDQILRNHIIQGTTYTPLPFLGA